MSSLGGEGMFLKGAAEDTGFAWFEEKEAEGRLHCPLQLKRRGSGKQGADLCSPVPSARTHGNGSQLCASVEL